MNLEQEFNLSVSSGTNSKNTIIAPSFVDFLKEIMDQQKTELEKIEKMQIKATA